MNPQACKRIAVFTVAVGLLAACASTPPVPSHLRSIFAFSRGSGASADSAFIVLNQSANPLAVTSPLMLYLNGKKVLSTESQPTASIRLEPGTYLLQAWRRGSTRFSRTVVLMKGAVLYIDLPSDGSRIFRVADTPPEKAPPEVKPTAP